MRARCYICGKYEKIENLLTYFIPDSYLTAQQIKLAHLFCEYKWCGFELIKI